MAVRAGLLTAALLAAALTGCASRVAGHGTLDLGALEPNCPGQTMSIKGPPLEQVVLPSTTKGPYYISAHALAAGVDVADWPESVLKAQYDRL
jgi:hypothetical protein